MSDRISSVSVDATVSGSPSVRQEQVTVNAVVKGFPSVRAETIKVDAVLKVSSNVRLWFVGISVLEPFVAQPGPPAVMRVQAVQ